MKKDSKEVSYSLDHTMNWQIGYYNQALQQEIMALPEGLQARYIHLTKRMMEFGPSLGMPHSRAMGEGLFELRLTAKEGQARVFYCTVVHNQNYYVTYLSQENSEDPEPRTRTSQT